MSTRTAAACAAAALATLALGATSPYAGGSVPTLGAAAGAEAGLARPSAGERGPPPRLHLAATDSGSSWPWSFLDSLFGPPPRSAPPSRRRPAAYRSSPQRDSQREGRGRQDKPSPVPAVAVPVEGPGASGAVAPPTYRTMCVRLCDGYYWPISFATNGEGFGRDSEICAKSCGTPAALYYYPNPGGVPEDMISIEGVPYRSLGTAFNFRSAYDASCKCRPHPWEVGAEQEAGRKTQ
jgi:hypothetical protein